jgi:heme A synthase
VVLHFAHRTGALAVLTAITVLAVRAHRSGLPALARLASAVVVLVIGQIALDAATGLTAKAVLPTTACVALGAAVLGSCWLLTLRALRCLRPLPRPYLFAACAAPQSESGLTRSGQTCTIRS